MEDLQINTFPITQLRKPSLNEFLEAFNKAAIACPTIQQKMARPWHRYHQAYKAFEQANLISRKSDQTADLANLDAQRNGIHTALMSATNSMRKSLNQETRQRATQVWNALKSFPVDLNASYTSESGQIDTLLTVLLDQQRDNLQQLGLLNLALDLQALLNQFRATLNLRTQEDIQRPPKAFVHARLRVIESWRQFIRYINAYTLVLVTEPNNPDPQLQEFIQLINSQINNYNHHAIHTHRHHTPDTNNTPPQPPLD